MRLLVIEDESLLREQLVHRLSDAGFVVDQAADGRTGAHIGQDYPIDLAIVDLGLPDIGGLEVIRQWRRTGLAFPVLILTARGRWQEKVAGLESGADDYLVKPFRHEELIARTRALLRRSGGWADSTLRCGPLAMDTRERTVVVDDEPVAITAFEYRVLEYLMHHLGEVVSKTDLVEHLYADSDQRDSNVIEVIIGRLRRKLDPRGRWQPIETRRGQGYRLRAPGPVA